VNKSIFKTILAVSRAHWRMLSIILVVGITQTFVGMYSLVFFQRLLDGFVGARQLADLYAPLAGYIGLTIFNHLLIYLEGYPTAVLDQGVLQWVKLRALEKIERIDFLAYQDLGTGNLIQTVENGAQATRDLLTGFYLNLARSIVPQLVISLGFIRYYDQGLFVMILAGYGLLYLVTFYSMRYLRGLMEAMLANQEDFSKFSVRAFMELVVFRINGRFKAEFERVRGISDEVVRARAKIYLLRELFASGFALLIFLIEVLVVVQQAGKILAGESTVGTLVALVSYVRIVFWPVTMFSLAWINYRMDAVTFDRFQAFFALPDDLGLERGQPLTIDQGRVEFRAVSFAYKDQEVLKDFSLVMEGCQTTALVGSSGSGKSTLVRLLLQLLKPQSGQVLVDGQDLSTVSLASYYPSVAYIPQEPPIFDGTLRENLTFGRSADPERVAAVIRQVGLAGLVSRLPKGLETTVGERGAKLSGGERQRLAFGRVLLQDPRLVILDEPTSALDSLTEDFITRGLIPFLKDRTVIIVAHRLQTVQSADQIIVLEQGQIVQRGAFTDLISTDGKFRQMWEKQAREEGYAEI
jgi:ATP-binding cassette subfamily B protein